MCLCEICPRELRLSPAEVVLTDKKIQRRVLFCKIGSLLQLVDALRDLLVFDQHKTLVDQLFEGLPVRNFRICKDPQTQRIAMDVLFLFDGVALAALAPHSLEPLCIYHAILGQQSNECSHQRTIEISVLRVTQQQVETSLQAL